MSLYSNEVREFISTRDWPKGLTYEVRDVFGPDAHIELIFFRDNWLTLTPQDHLRCTVIVKEVITKLWADGIPAMFGKIESVP